MDDGLGQDQLDELLAQAHYQGGGADSRYSIRLEQRDGLFFLVVEGMVLTPTPEDFIQRIERILASLERRGMVIDLCACSYLSSTVLSHLVRFFDATITRQSQMVLLRPADKVRKTVELLGLTELFLMVDDEDMARAFFTQQGLLG